ncbi:hypothetical protein AB4Y45_34995 [Paraburkholderia sp. EG287A]|uniref:hypothetical protein n=1 Tax=Paraburkholderia sp. EG287A TaxID=3237012 RepID=UPI0034D21547
MTLSLSGAQLSCWALSFAGPGGSYTASQANSTNSRGKSMTKQTETTFKYRPNYVAAWLDVASEAMLADLGLRRRVHLTTFFDGYGQMLSVKPYPWSEPKEARISAVVEWKVGDDTHLIAELAECEWSHVINSHYLAQGVREDYPHRPHVTLDKRVEVGTAARFQCLVGKVIRFDRHGGEIDDRPAFMVEGDVTLRDWKVEQFDKDRIRVWTPPLGSGIRESHMADRNGLDGDGFFMLARAMLSAARARGGVEADHLAEQVTMAILKKQGDPSPGINWQCSRHWTVNDVRRLVRDALDTAGITKASEKEFEPAPKSMVQQLLG